MTVAPATGASTPYTGSHFSRAMIALDAPPAAAILVAEASQRRERLRPAATEVVELATALATPGLLQPRDAELDEAKVTQARQLLARVAALGVDADILAEHTISEFPFEVARAAVSGYTLSFLGDRIEELLDATELDVTAAPRDGGNWLIGMVRFEAGSANRSLGDYAGWDQTVEWDAQSVELIFDPRSMRVGASVAARSVSRRTYAAFGGCPVPGTHRDEQDVQPYTDSRSTYEYAAAKAIATAGELFGGQVVLARGVRLEMDRYVFAGADPRSQAWRIVIESREEATR